MQNADCNLSQMCSYVKSKKERKNKNEQKDFLDITILKIDLKSHNDGVPSLFQ